MHSGSRNIHSIITQNHKGLLRLWALSLSDEGRIIEEALGRQGKMLFNEVAQTLKENEKVYFTSDRASEQLQYTGIVAIENNSLRIVNLIYLNNYGKFTF